MRALMSIFRTPRRESSPRPAAGYFVVVSSDNTAVEFMADGERAGFSADSITALFIGPTTVDALTAHLRSAGTPLVVPVSSDNPSDGAGAVRQRILLSPAALLLTQRMRQRAHIMQSTSADESRALLADGESSCSASFLDYVLGELLRKRQESVTRRSAFRHAVLVHRARRLLSASPASAHRLAELADTLGVSAFHFARVFRAETGLSVHQYLLRLRMACALHQLSRWDTDLSRLALDLGFSSHSHFTAAFHKQFSESPARVRDLLERDRRFAGARHWMSTPRKATKPRSSIQGSSRFTKFVEASIATELW